MILSDVSVKRPVFAAVLSIMLVAFGVLSFSNLPLREMPSVDVPIVSINTTYRGASAEIVEDKITKTIEKAVAGIEGVDYMSATSRQDSSSVMLFFKLDRNIDLAFNDVQASVERIRNALPKEADQPRLSKMDPDAFAIMWFSLSSDTMDKMALSDFANKSIIDRLATVDGVGEVQGGNESLYSMRIWLDRVALAARGLTVNDVTNALQSENTELPAGTLESEAREFPIRIIRSFANVDDFKRLVVGRGDDGHLIRLAEVARVELGPDNEKIFFQGNGGPQLGIGIVKQSTANALDVARGVRAEIEKIKRDSLPEGIEIDDSFDTTVFVERAISEVQKTLLIATGLVVLVIYVFLGSLRAALVPAVVVPVCLIATFGILDFSGATLNLMTLLALVLCIGLVVDDSIVVLENIQRRVDQGEPPLLAAYRGARQVAFAVIATTVVIVAVFAPLIFTQGFIGRVFGELGITVAGAVILSSFVALSLSPMMCSKLLSRKRSEAERANAFMRFFDKLRDSYIVLLKKILPYPWLGVPLLVVIFAFIGFLGTQVGSESQPAEDRGIINVNITAPEGTGFDYMVGQAKQLEQMILPYVDNGEAQRVTIRVPGGWGASRKFNSARGMLVLEDWDDRERTGHEISAELQRMVGQLPGVFGFAGMQQGGMNAWGPPMQFVIRGGSYDAIIPVANLMVEEARKNPGLTRVDMGYKPTKPQMQLEIDRTRAAALGVSAQAIGQTLETALGSRRVTTFELEGKGDEYDVIVQARDVDRETTTDLTNINVRPDRGGDLIPLSNLVKVTESADTAQRKRWNRQQSITVTAFLNENYSMGEAVEFFETTFNEKITTPANFDFNGEARMFKEQGGDLIFVFLLALLVVFLVLAAQFESFIHPLIIMFTVPVAIAGALLGLFLVGSTLNIFSAIGIIILIGIAAKNGILIVEFANQLRDQGREFMDALVEASATRFRPIIMTGVSTAAGSMPLVMTTGPGSASRLTIGIVIVLGVLVSTVMTLFIVPLFYNLMARRTGSPQTIARKLSEYEGARPNAPLGGPAE